MGRITLVIVCLLYGIAAEARQYLFHNYSIEEGLSQSVVNCMYQDTRGFLWIGTQNGLNRFNGYDFTQFLYNPDDTNSISNNWIYAINGDKEGNLWIGTKNGINKYIPAENRFVRIPYTTGYISTVSRCAYDIMVSRSGLIYINTPPVLSVHDPVKMTIVHYQTELRYLGAVNDNRIPLMEDADGSVWMGSTSGLACFDPRTHTFTYFLHDAAQPGSISNDNITALCQDRNGKIWVGTSDGLNIIDKKRGIIYRFPLRGSEPSDNNSRFIRALIQDPDGSIWVGTEGAGLIRISTEQNRYRVADCYTASRHGLGHDIVLTLAIDRSLNLLAGTLQGISKTDLKPTKFRLYRRDNTSSSVDLSGNVIASIYKDEGGLLWIGTWGQGLNRYNRETGSVERFSMSLPGNHYLTNDFVHVIFRDKEKNIWIGTRDGLHVFDAKNRRFIRLKEFFKAPMVPDFRGMRICMVIAGRDGSYWIGTQSGLYRILPGWSATEVFTADSPPHHRIGGNLIYCIREDHEGKIWIATLNGLDVYDPVSLKMTHFRKNESKNSLCDNFVISLCEDENGDMWIGTGSYVNKYVRKDSTFLYYAKKDGLPNNNIFEILRDHQNTMWFATGSGLSRFDKATGTFRTYTVDEGLQSPEFNIRACFNSPDGEVFFGGMNGLNSFYPEQLGDNLNIPEILITAVYKSTRMGKEYVEPDRNGTVVLQHSDQTFTIEFVALEYTNPEKNQYAYTLEGLSNGWVHIGNRRFVPFTNLPPGEYTFRVKGSNNDGVWNQAGRSIRILILPPWWRSWWAWTIYGLILVGIIIVYIRLRERKLRQERDILENKIHERTLQIEKKNLEIVQKNETLNNLNSELTALNVTKDKFFSIIAHDLRNPFNSIIGLTDIVLGNLDSPDIPKIRKSVGDIRDASRHAFDLLQNLLIWGRSQTGNLDFKPVAFDLAERIQENIDLVAGQATRKNITLRSDITDLIVVQGDVQMINTIFRNLLTNAIKFTAREGEVVVSACISDSICRVSVKDTGTGIAPEIMNKLFHIESKYTRKGTEQERGTGLGLILCKEFVEKHGGNITVITEPKKGSCFTVTLPLVSGVE